MINCGSAGGDGSGDGGGGGGVCVRTRCWAPVDLYTTETTEVTTPINWRKEEPSESATKSNQKNWESAPHLRKGVIVLSLECIVLSQYKT